MALLKSERSDFYSAGALTLMAFIMSKSLSRMPLNFVRDETVIILPLSFLGPGADNTPPSTVSLWYETRPLFSEKQTK